LVDGIPTTGENFGGYCGDVVAAVHELPPEFLLRMNDPDVG
jgi:hypothetical protein